MVTYVQDVDVGGAMLQCLCIGHSPISDVTDRVYALVPRPGSLGMPRGMPSVWVPGCNP